jgi:hypothetical protein
MPGGGDFFGEVAHFGTAGNMHWAVVQARFRIFLDHEKPKRSM